MVCTETVDSADRQVVVVAAVAVEQRHLVATALEITVGRKRKK